jgi:hypothetical protein
MDELQGHDRTQYSVVDETSRSEARQKAWRWFVVTLIVTVFQIAATRGDTVAGQLLGSTYGVVVMSDRWKVSNGFRRRFCWSHPYRHFPGEDRPSENRDFSWGEAALPVQPNVRLVATGPRREVELVQLSGLS